MLEILRAYFLVKPAAALCRLALDIATRQDFIELIKPYLTNTLTKGIPSLSADLKPLYKDLSKRQLIEDTIIELHSTYVSPLIIEVLMVSSLSTMLSITTHSRTSSNGCRR